MDKELFLADLIRRRDLMKRPLTAAIYDGMIQRVQRGDYDKKEKD